MPGASPDRVVHDRAEGLLPAFAEAAADLVAEGADAIITTCGFLILFQAKLQARVAVPVATSSLLQVPTVARCLPPGRRPGIVTIAASSLSRDHLLAAGADAGTPVGGVATGSHFARVFLGGETRLDPEEAERDVVAAALRLAEDCGDLGALILECANMGPYASAVRRATGLPVHDAVSLGLWLHAGLRPRSFPREPG